MFWVVSNKIYIPSTQGRENLEQEDIILKSVSLHVKWVPACSCLCLIFSKLMCGWKSPLGWGDCSGSHHPPSGGWGMAMAGQRAVGAPPAVQGINGLGPLRMAPLAVVVCWVHLRQSCPKCGLTRTRSATDLLQPHASPTGLVCQRRAQEPVF